MPPPCVGRHPREPIRAAPGRRCGDTWSSVPRGRVDGSGVSPEDAKSVRRAAHARCCALERRRDAVSSPHDQIRGVLVILKLVFLMTNYDPTYSYDVESNIVTLLITREYCIHSRLIKMFTPRLSGRFWVRV